MNKIVINFTTCSPPPSGGYKIFYREEGSTGIYTEVGPFYSSPAIFYDDINPPGTCYEGYIVSDCGNDVFGNHILFSTCDSSAVSMDNSSCGTTLTTETTDLGYVNLGLFDLHVDGAVTVHLNYNVYGRPNRFTLYEDGSTIQSTGWKGYAPYPGPWGLSLSTSESGDIVFNPLPGKVYKIRVEAGPAGPSPYDLADNYTITVSCS